MKFFRRSKAADANATPVEQAPLSVFQEDVADGAQHQANAPVVAEDIDFVDVAMGNVVRDDNAPFGPELPDHVVATPERERRRRRVRFGPASLEKAEEPVLAPRTDAVDSARAEPSLEASGAESFKGAEPVEPFVMKGPEVEATAPKGFAGKLRKAVKRTPKATRPTANFPVRVLIGFLPEVTERDALSFAMGVADKHVENIENAHYDVFPHMGGFVYEVHEGGTGAAFAPAVLEYFESLGPFRSDVEARMHIRTATRTVEVVRKPQQIEAVLLPESAGLQTTPQPDAGPLMRPAMNKRQGVLVVGAVVFVTGFFAALVIGSFMRLVPAEDIRPGAAETLNVSEMPYGQWASRLQNVPDGKYVKALRFDRKSKWRTENADTQELNGEATPQAQQGN